MTKIFGIVSLSLALTGCATFNTYRSKAIDMLCANKDTLIAMALANGDMATVKAIDAYCPAILTPVAPVAP